MQVDAPARLASVLQGEGWRLPDREARSIRYVLGAALAYCFVIVALSDFPARMFAESAGSYFSIAAVAALFVASAYALVCLFDEGARENAASRIIFLGAAAIVVAITFSSFIIFKQVLLPERGFVWDRTFMEIGRALFFGESAWVVTHRLLGLTATRFLDSLYSLWVVLAFGCPLVAMAAFRDSRKRLRILIGWVAAWVAIGTVAAWIFASAGPCYFNAVVGPDTSYALLDQRLADLARAAADRGTPIGAVPVQHTLLAAYQSGDYLLAGGISAMPSMHVALAVLLALAGFEYSRTCGAAMTVYAVLIWIGSVHLGWHYFVDGPVAALLMFGLWKLAGLAAQRLLGEAPA